MPPEITCVECVEFSYPVPDVGTVDTEFGGGVMYIPGETLEARAFALRIETDGPAMGECISRIPTVAMAQIDLIADSLLGKNPLQRERLWSEIRRGLRKYDGMGLGPVDIALWDLAGKHRGAPVHELLGTYRTRLPTYASTFHGENNGGLSSPTDYADFAERCLDMGYPAFKVHGFDHATDDRQRHERDAALIDVLGDRVGTEMDLMIDCSCKYETFAQALEVGKACDRNDFLWYEDPYRDGGRSQHGHRTLRDRLDTPILMGEMVRGVEPHADDVAAEATDFVRADPEYDGGITGAMKIARVAEGFGLDVEIHATGPAHRHCVAAARNANYYELALVHPDCPNPTDIPAYQDYSDALDAVDADGTLPVPDDPGLGVDIDWEFVHEHETRRRTYT